MVDTKSDRPKPSRAQSLAGGLLPFLAVIAWGSIFDSQGNNAFVATIVNLFLLSPVLLFFGFATGVFYYHSPMFRRFVWVIDSVLVSVMFVGLVLIPSVFK